MLSTTKNIIKAEAKDLPEILSLLKSLDLPITGVNEHVENFFLVKKGNEVIACIGIEIYTDIGLLRSAAVKPEYQGQGLGKYLTEKILFYAQEKQCKELYLLTTTAKNFFIKFGFQQIIKEDVNPTVKQSEEFKGACPDTAIIMRKTI